MKMSRTWDATMSMIPRGGGTIWGGLDWSPEEGYSPCKSKSRDDDAQNSGQHENQTDSKAKYYSYGRMMSFGKDAAEAHPSDLKRIDFRVILILNLILSLFLSYELFTSTCFNFVDFIGGGCG